MTRENKLALVIGFGLILVVAILISDHFSAARAQESADLTPPADPLAMRVTDPRLVDFAPGPPERFAASNAGSLPPGTASAGAPPEPPAFDAEAAPVQAHDPLAAAAPGGGEVAAISMPDLQAMEVKYRVEGRLRFHEVQSRESLTTICRTYYQDETLVRALASFNGIADPDLVRSGVRLVIPARETLGPIASPGESGASRAAASTLAPAPPPATVATYTVKPGEVLSVLAQDLLGTASRWRELYEYNRDVIRDPDNVRAGTVIRIPPRGG